MTRGPRFGTGTVRVTYTEKEIVNLLNDGIDSLESEKRRIRPFKVGDRRLSQEVLNEIATSFIFNLEDPLMATEGEERLDFNDAKYDMLEQLAEQYG